MTKEEVKTYLSNHRIGILIPTYNNDQTLEEVATEASSYCADVLVVDDGSTDQTKDIISRWKGQIHTVSYEQNRGKGNALKEGFLLAKSLGLTHVITIDSDGQHKLSDLPLFVEAHKSHPDAFIIGSRSFDHPNMPNKNSFANRFSNFWFTLQTAHRLPDTQTGYRLYPLAANHYMTPFNKRYEAELELLVRSAWRLLPIVSIPIHVYYPPKEERVSHFRPGKDFFRISVLNTVLCVLAIVYGYPSMIIRSIFRKLKALFKQKTV
ncbi:MAG: glycosyltransferase family 2 protein [Paludibacteraceae bacterium]|nr:glycosyltransferase family 2 protein [Paludibacteraceae bacterium]MBR5971637.1 glycosyltransferase family 2 protein [Paludibacteraceae bacterium]